MGQPPEKAFLLLRGQLGPNLAMAFAGRTSRQALAERIERLTVWEARARALRQRLYRAVAYPCALGAVGLTITIAAGVLILPHMIGALELAGAAVPRPTMALLQVMLYIRDWWLVLSALALLSGAWCLRHGKRYIRKAFFKIKPVSVLLRDYGAMIFCRSSAQYLDAGLGELDAIQLACECSRGFPGESERSEFYRFLKSGVPAATCTLTLDRRIGDAVSAAASGGSLSRSLEQAADSMDESLNTRLDLAISMAQPVLVTIVSALIGIIAILISLPVLAPVTEVY